MPANHDLVEYTQTASKTSLNYSLASSYTYTKILLDTIIKAGSADPKAVIATL